MAELTTHYLAVKFVLSNNKERLQKDINEGCYRPYIVEFVDDGMGAGIEAVKRKLCRDLDDLWESWQETNNA